MPRDWQVDYRNQVTPSEMTQFMPELFGWKCEEIRRVCSPFAFVNQTSPKEPTRRLNPPIWLAKQVIWIGPCRYHIVRASWSLYERV